MAKIGVPERGAAKVAQIPVKVVPSLGPSLKKPEWIRAKYSAQKNVNLVKQLLRQQQLVTVCEEASCPNLGDCFSRGTATFMIMGDLCTRRCPFCDVAHGRPLPLDENEPTRLAEAICTMNLKYVVITSVDRDDLRDGGAKHFAKCIQKIRKSCPQVVIEILVPDFRRRMNKALDALQLSLPDVFNHNLETVPRLYRKARPGADYISSLELISKFKQRNPLIPTKSGIMLGLGETIQEVKEVLRDLRKHDCEMITIGQYLQPSKYHLPVERYVEPSVFDELSIYGYELGFNNMACGPMIRSSYHADLQIKESLHNEQ